MKQETLEEAADNYLNSHDMLDNNSYNGFVSGAKWQVDRMYSDMQEYAEFCVKCDRNKMPLLTVEDWFKQYKK